MLHSYVISIATATTRREHVISEFSKHNINFSFYDAITPSIELTKLIQSIAPNLNQVIHMTDGEKSCLMSHIMLWKKCVDDYYYVVRNKQQLLDAFGEILGIQEELGTSSSQKIKRK